MAMSECLQCKNGFRMEDYSLAFRTTTCSSVFSSLFRCGSIMIWGRFLFSRKLTKPSRHVKILINIYMFGISRLHSLFLLLYVCSFQDVCCKGLNVILSRFFCLWQDAENNVFAFSWGGESKTKFPNSSVEE